MSSMLKSFIFHRCIQFLILVVINTVASKSVSVLLKAAIYKEFQFIHGSYSALISNTTGVFLTLYLCKVSFFSCIALVMVLILLQSGSLLCLLFTFPGRVTEHRKYSICRMLKKTFFLLVLLLQGGFRNRSALHALPIHV